MVRLLACNDDSTGGTVKEKNKKKKVDRRGGKLSSGHGWTLPVQLGHTERNN